MAMCLSRGSTADIRPAAGLRQPYRGCYTGTSTNPIDHIYAIPRRLLGERGGVKMGHLWNLLVRKERTGGWHGGSTGQPEAISSRVTYVVANAALSAPATHDAYPVVVERGRITVFSKIP
jgi:hypothetical protein